MDVWRQTDPSAGTPHEPFPPRPVRSALRCRCGAADRLHQPLEPDVGPRGITAERDSDSFRAGSQPLASGAPDVDREPGALFPGGGTRALPGLYRNTIFNRHPRRQHPSAAHRKDGWNSAALHCPDSAGDGYPVRNRTGAPGFRREGVRGVEGYGARNE